MRKTSKKLLTAFLIALLSIGSIASYRSDASWILQPKGYVLPEPMAVGDISTLKKTVEKLEIQKATIEIQDDKLKAVEDEIRAVSIVLAENQKKIEELPKQFEKQIKIQTAKAESKGIFIGLLVGVGLAIAVGN